MFLLVSGIERRLSRNRLDSKTDPTRALMAVTAFMGGIFERKFHFLFLEIQSNSSNGCQNG